MKPVIFHPLAEGEYREAIAWYEAKRPGLGEDLQTEVEAVLHRIENNPKSFTPYRVSGIRKGIVNKFPYKVFFLEMDTLTTILTIAHHKRRPDYWLDRIP